MPYHKSFILVSGYVAHDMVNNTYDTGKWSRKPLYTDRQHCMSAITRIAKREKRDRKEFEILNAEVRVWVDE